MKTRPCFALVVAVSLVSCIFIGISPAWSQTDCCYPHGYPGCEDFMCEDCVCGFDFMCCMEMWEPSCVMTAASICAGACSEACASSVELVDFHAAGSAGRVLIEWETAAEIDNAGFHLSRSASEEGDYTHITEALIPAEGGPSQGATYSFEDKDVNPGTTYWFMLEDIDSSGAVTLHGPVSAVVPPQFCGAAAGIPSKEVRNQNLLLLIVPATILVLHLLRRRSHRR